ncbi:MAG: cohesin domain-containing protein [Caldilineaceae bacterium]
MVLQRSTRFTRLFSYLLVVLFSLSSIPVYAVPQLPSSFWGTVTNGGASAAAGLVVTAWINGVQYAQGQTLISGGQTYYSLDIPSDDTDTPGIEGGKEADTVIFKISGQATGQSGVWHSGTTVQQNLTIPQVAASLLSVTPNSGTVGSSQSVTLVGSNTHFTSTSTINFGAGITVSNTTVLSSTQMSANLLIAANATVGTRDVVISSGAEVVTKSAAFAVQGPGVLLQMPPLATGPIGSQVSLPVNLPNDVTGKNILAYQFKLTFDPAVLQATGISLPSSLSANGWTVSETHATPGQIFAVGYSATPLAGSGALLFVNFTVTNTVNAQTALSLSNLLFNEGEPAAQTQNGQFQAQSLSISGVISYALNSSLMTGVTVTVAGSKNYSATSDAQGQYYIGINQSGSYTVTPSKQGDQRGISAYDAALILRCVLQLQSCAAAAADSSNDGQVTGYDAAFIAQYLLGTANPASQVGQWRFSPANRVYANFTSTVTSQNYAAYLVGDVSGNWLPGGVQLQAAEEDVVNLEVGHGALNDDQTSLTTLRLSNQGGTELFAYQMQVSYDPATMEFIDLVTEGSLSADWTVSSRVQQPGKLLVVAYGATSVNGSGDLLHLKFRYTADASSAPMFVAVDSLEFNEGSPAAQVVDGKQSLYLPLLSQ